jgi:hypothetical protein
MNMPIREVCSPVNNMKKPTPLPHPPDKSRGVQHAGIYDRSGQSAPRTTPSRPDTSNPDPFPGRVVTGSIDLRPDSRK